MASNVDKESSRGRQAQCCPVCDGEIEHGSVSVHGTRLGFFFVGFSYQHCWFKGRSAKEQIVIHSDRRTRGFRCLKCGFVGVYKASPPPVDPEFNPSW